MTDDDDRNRLLNDVLHSKAPHSQRSKRTVDRIRKWLLGDVADSGRRQAVHRRKIDRVRSRGTLVAFVIVAGVSAWAIKLNGDRVADNAKLVTAIQNSRVQAVLGSCSEANQDRTMRLEKINDLYQHKRQHVRSGQQLFALRQTRDFSLANVPSKQDCGARVQRLIERTTKSP